MAFSGMINLKSGQLTLGGQFEAYKRGQLERNIHNANNVNYAYNAGVIQISSRTHLTLKT